MANREIKKQKHRLKLKKRIRKKISGTPEKPRLVVYRGNTNVMAQLVDDSNQKTLGTVASVAASYEKAKKSAEGKMGLSHQIGLDVAALAKDMKISNVVFDRNGYKYHGRVKAIAEGAREGGLKF